MVEASEVRPVPVSGRPTSPWAAASIIVSLGFLCPLATLVGPLLGFRALVAIRADPRLGGRRLALAGIVLGLATAAGWAGFALWWHLQARRPMLQGPALAAALEGDLARFQADFSGPGRDASEVEAAAFAAALRQRYGRFISASPVGGGPLDPRGTPITYALRFERGQVDAEAEFVVWPRGSRAPAPGFGWIAIRDDALGDLVYPSSRSADATVGPRAIPEAGGAG